MVLHISRITDDVTFTLYLSVVLVSIEIMLLYVRLLLVKLFVICAQFRLINPKLMSSTQSRKETF